MALPAPLKKRLIHPNYKGYSRRRSLMFIIAEMNGDSGEAVRFSEI
jgi:hypothetical protein